jgi:predicted HNH restriction endonuclease
LQQFKKFCCNKKSKKQKELAMVTKSLKFKDEEYKQIEKILNETGLSFAEFARQKLLSNETNNNIIDLQNFEKILQSNLKILDTQIAKYLTVLINKIENYNKKVNNFLENKTYSTFFRVADRSTGKEEDDQKIKDIKTYSVGDVIVTKRGLKFLIIKIDHEKEIISIIAFPIEEEFLNKVVDLTIKELSEEVLKILRLKNV